MSRSPAIGQSLNKVRSYIIYIYIYIYINRLTRSFSVYIIYVVDEEEDNVWRQPFTYGLYGVLAHKVYNIDRFTSLYAITISSNIPNIRFVYLSIRRFQVLRVKWLIHLHNIIILIFFNKIDTELHFIFNKELS
jgi:hypothetical protein